MVRRHANTDTRFSIDNQPLLPRAARGRDRMLESAPVEFCLHRGTGEWRQCTADPQGEVQASSDEDSVHICQTHTTRQTAQRAHSRSRTGEFVRTARTLDKRTRLNTEADLGAEAQYLCRVHRIRLERSLGVHSFDTRRPAAPYQPRVIRYHDSVVLQAPERFTTIVPGEIVVTIGCETSKET